MNEIFATPRHRILIIGAGHIGRALGETWRAQGHDIRFGVRNPDDGKHADLSGFALQAASARGDADIVVLATPFEAARRIVGQMSGLDGAIVIDCTNPLIFADGRLQLAVGHSTSGAEEIAAAIPGAFVFKAFNQTGAENMAAARQYPSRPVMFVAGDNASLKPEVMGLVADLGFEPVDAGPLAAARLLEPLAMLWIELALKLGQGRDFAFGLLRKPNN